MRVRDGPDSHTRPGMPGACTRLGCDAAGLVSDARSGPSSCRKFLYRGGREPYSGYIPQVSEAFSASGHGSHARSPPRRISSRFADAVNPPSSSTDLSGLFQLVPLPPTFVRWHHGRRTGLAAGGNAPPAVRGFAYTVFSRRGARQGRARTSCPKFRHMWFRPSAGRLAPPLPGETHGQGPVRRHAAADRHDTRSSAR